MSDRSAQEQLASSRRREGARSGSTAMSTDLPLLEGYGLTKRYGGVVAVDDVAFSLKKGEILGLVGPNGAGKTTLVDLITGAQPSDGGVLRLAGKTVSGPPARRAKLGLSRTFQHPLLAAELSILENLVVGVAAARFGSVWRLVRGVVGGMITGPGPDYKRGAALAGELGIEDLDRQCGDLSLGEQRLVEVARALAQDPLVMLLDEPFAGADSNGISGIIDAIRQVQSRGHGVVLVDHNVDLIARLADRVLLLDQGRVVFDGDPAACLASPEMRAVYFGGADE